MSKRNENIGFALAVINAFTSATGTTSDQIAEAKKRLEETLGEKEQFEFMDVVLSRKNLRSVLNDYGREGWAVASANVGDGMSVMVLFQRRIQPIGV
jgi:hypothetical protein